MQNNKKRLGVIIFLPAIIFACHTQKKIVSSEKNVEQKTVSLNDSIFNGTEGKILLAKSDCLVCHKINEQLIGPSYKNVAAKYSEVDTAVAYLSNKIINGGSGVWGKVPMTPHKYLSKADAEKIVKFILLLKNQ